MLLLVITSIFVPSNGSSSNSLNINIAIVPGETNERLIALAQEYSKYLSMMEEYNDTLSFTINISVKYDFNDTLLKLKKGSYDALIFIPKDAYRYLIKNSSVKIKLFILTSVTDRTKEQLVRSILTGFFRETAHYIAIKNLYNITKKVVLCDLGLKSEFESLSRNIWENYKIDIISVVPGEVANNPRPLIIGWMTLAVMFINFIFGGITGGASLITSEVRLGFLERLLSTRLKPSEYFTGLAFSWIILLTITSFPALVLGFVLLGGKLSTGITGISLMYIILIILVSEFLTFAIGILIGILSRSPEGSTVISNIVSWIMMTLGGFWMPKWMLPETFRWFSEVNLLSVLFYALSDVAIYNKPIDKYIVPLTIACLSSFIIFIITAIIYTRYLPKLLEKK